MVALANRRAFLFVGAATLAMPSIVRAESLMKLFVPKPEIIAPMVSNVFYLTPEGFMTFSQITSKTFKWSVIQHPEGFRIGV